MSQTVELLETTDPSGHEHDESGRFAAKHAAHTLASHLTSEALHDPDEFRQKYSRLEDAHKKVTAKELAGRGLLHPVDARKRGILTASEIIQSARGQYKAAKQQHEGQPLNRHVPFAESDVYKKMAGSPPRSPAASVREVKESRGTGIADLYEYVASGPSLKVDRAAGMIRGVKILGWSSANKRRYLPEGVDTRMYEGRRVYTDHSPKAASARSVRDVFGWHEGVRKEADGLYGDLHVLNPKSELAESVFQAAERRPDLFGMSHHAQGKERRDRDGSIIESVTEVRSIDLVAEPATTNSLFEHREAPMKTTLRALLEAAGRTTWLQELEDAPMMDAPMDAPATGTDGRELLRQALAALAGGSEEDHELANKIMKILKPSAAAAPEETPAEESRRPTLATLQEQFNLRLKARDLCAEQGVIANKVLLKALDACADLAEARAMIDEHKASVGKVRSQPTPPRAVAAGNGTALQENKAPLDLKQLGAWLRT